MQEYDKAFGAYLMRAAPSLMQFAIASQAVIVANLINHTICLILSNSLR